MAKTTLTINQAETLTHLLMSGEWKTANILAYSYGVKDGVNAETFEAIIKKLGLTMNVIYAIAKYYEADIKTNGGAC